MKSRVCPNNCEAKIVGRPLCLHAPTWPCLCNKLQGVQVPRLLVNDYFAFPTVIDLLQRLFLAHLCCWSRNLRYLHAPKPDDVCAVIGTDSG